MQIVRKVKPGRKQTRKRMPRSFGFQPLERRALLAADLGADWETFVEPEWIDESVEAQVWTDEKVVDDDMAIRIRSFGGDEVDVKTLEEGDEPVLYTLFGLPSEEGVEDVKVEEFELYEATDIAAMTGEMFVGGGWHNPDAPHDVNADGYVSPIDALLLITYLNNHGVGEFGEGEGPSIYPDIDGDGQLAPLDALLLFNYLNDNLPSLDGFSLAADEALPENEAAGLIAGRMALRDESLVAELFDDASASDVAQDSDAVWADESMPDWFATELSEKKLDDVSLEASDDEVAASDELVDALIVK